MLELSVAKKIRIPQELYDKILAVGESCKNKLIDHEGNLIAEAKSQLVNVLEQAIAEGVFYPASITDDLSFQQIDLNVQVIQDPDDQNRLIALFYFNDQRVEFHSFHVAVIECPE